MYTAVSDCRYLPSRFVPESKDTGTGQNSRTMTLVSCQLCTSRFSEREISVSKHKVRERDEGREKKSVRLQFLSPTPLLLVILFIKFYLLKFKHFVYFAFLLFFFFLLYFGHRTIPCQHPTCPSTRSACIYIALWRSF